MTRRVLRFNFSGSREDSVSSDEAADSAYD
jgi:hypothetical protein